MGDPKVSCKNVLIVEDDRAIRQMIQDVLEVEGYNVHSACDGSEGIEQLRALAPAPCVVLLDLMMPGTNGWKFLDFQRSDPKLSGIPVIVCSAYSESAKSVKPHAIIEKPVRLDALLSAVHAFCA
jgi:CheY-like chemotaxis protein